MTLSLLFTTVLTGLALTAVPAAVFLWSGDDARRRRAWRLLTLLRRTGPGRRVLSRRQRQQRR